MKALLLLFSIYLLALGCLPCADDACAANKPTVAASSATDCHNEESCPPFCTCACCSIHIASVSATLISILPLQVVAQGNLLFSLHQPLLARAGNSIWQPPRLG